MHLVFVSVLSLKFVAFFLELWDLMIKSRTGESSTILEVTWKLVNTFQEVGELMMFLLIALGWKIERDDIGANERRMALGLSMISLHLGFLELSCNSTAACSGYKLSRYILHSLGNLVIIVTMNFNLQVLYSQIAEAQATIDIRRKYEHYRAYRIFRWIFLLFILAPTVLGWLKVNFFNWDE